MQGRVMSAIEATANIAVGYGVALAATAVVLPLFGFDVNVQQIRVFTKEEHRSCRNRSDT